MNNHKIELCKCKTASPIFRVSLTLYSRWTKTDSNLVILGSTITSWLSTHPADPKEYLSPTAPFLQPSTRKRAVSSSQQKLNSPTKRHKLIEIQANKMASSPSKTPKPAKRTSFLRKERAGQQTPSRTLKTLGKIPQLLPTSLNAEASSTHYGQAFDESEEHTPQLRRSNRPRSPTKIFE